MERFDLYLTSVQIKTLKKISKKMGYPIAEIIRRALDEWLEKCEVKGKKL